jgi:hypothetical protein
VAETQGTSLLTTSARVAEFTSGDVFGLFSDKPNWHPIDLGRACLEAAANPKPAAAEAHTAQAVPALAQ